MIFFALFSVEAAKNACDTDSEVLFTDLFELLRKKFAVAGCEKIY